MSEQNDSKTSPGGTRTLDVLVRRFPIDFTAIAKESGCTKGKLCKSDTFGWGIQNGNGDADFCCITPPSVGKNEELRIENNEWCVYRANKRMT